MCAFFPRVTDFHPQKAVESLQFKDLTSEQKAKARECKTPEELLELAKEEGYSLTDEQLESISGGWSSGSCSSYTPLNIDSW